MLLFLDHFLDFLFAGLDSSNYFLALEFLKGEDLVELAFELLHKVFLAVLIPRRSLGLSIGIGGTFDDGCLECSLEVIVGDVMPVVVFDERGAKLLTKPAESS